MSEEEGRIEFLEVPKVERQMVSRARDAMNRLVGLDLGDKLADDLWTARQSLYVQKKPPHE